MYQFFLNMWVFRDESEVTEDDIRKAATRGYITEEEAEQIIATPREAQ